MMIVGCDYHPSWQQVSWLDSETGETGEQSLVHASGEAQKFYRQLSAPALVGMEATGNCQWFVELVEDLGHTVWIGDAAQIRASYVRKQKTDKRDATHILKLLLEGRFPRLWAPDREQRDLRQLVLHRHKLVAMRTRVKNQLRSVALNEGIGRKPGLWSRKGQEQFRGLQLPAWTQRRRQDNLELLSDLQRRMSPLDQAVREQAERRPEVARLMSHPGVGAVTALAFVLTIGDPARFACGKQVASYLGLIPAEYSSGGRQRLGHITKQGNALLRSLLVEAAHAAARVEPELGRYYRRLAMKKHRSLAAVAVARKLALRLWWMWRRESNYQQWRASGSHAG